jgi:large subunit ribosomal protein L10
MAITFQEKEAILNLLQNEVAPQKAVLLVTTKDAKDTLDSEGNFKFRSTARKDGVVVRVVKNTLISRVFETPEPLTGQTIVAYLENKEESDEVTVPKTIVDIINDDFKDTLSIVGSFINGEYYDPAKTKVIASVATKDQSMSQVAGLLQTITSRIAVGIKEIPTSVARGVSEYSKTI